jgi:hypothetical protein
MFVKICFVDSGNSCVRPNMRSVERCIDKCAALASRI